MPRRKKCRKVFLELPACEGTVEFTPDELEALRLADIEGLTQIEAAELMGVSQPTFHRILKEARRKASMAVLGRADVRIVGGENVMRIFRCFNCGHEWGEPFGTGRPENCPECGSANIHRGVCRGRGRGGRRGKGNCGR
ncbi:DUF134 domain-containing protein [Archaeoglobus veneficus]|uniref:Uncharacterized protein n=1 Tax=Archaeoglobus veneficus (strain DSM 11195 / SNP6) TaxID=693661 RepID=F2KPX7_ARCVS|nr:DUF134 domain-containing protein [Archaeoglobus veneficus]AEA46484.1 protein of unknown function DUF134 [Archaeoglobus veneficus SNP6]